MRKIVLVLAVALTSVGLTAQEKAEAKGAVKDRWNGTITKIDKDNSSFTVRNGNTEKDVVYDSSTKWTKQGKTADQSEVKDGSKVTCVGKFDDKGRLQARTCALTGPPTWP